MSDQTQSNDLRGMQAPGRVEFGSTSKIVAAVIVVLVIGTAGAYSYKAGAFNPQPHSPVADRDLPSPTAPGTNAP
jgi:hypothetical protein